MAAGLKNQPSGNSSTWYMVDVFKHNPSWTVQVAYQFTSGTCPVYIRTQNNGSWYNWRLFNPGTANTAQVLTGYTFSSANGVNLSGTIANRGKLNWSGSNTTYSVPAGYYSGGTLDSRPSYTNGYNAGNSAGRSLKSKTYSAPQTTSDYTWKNTGNGNDVYGHIQISLGLEHILLSAHIGTTRIIAIPGY